MIEKTIMGFPPKNLFDRRVEKPKQKQEADQNGQNNEKGQFYFFKHALNFSAATSATMTIALNPSCRSSALKIPSVMKESLTLQTVKAFLPSSAACS